MFLCRSLWSGPLEWMRSSLAAKERKQDSETAVKEAREKAKASGTASVFEYDEVVPEKPLESPLKMAKAGKVRTDAYFLTTLTYSACSFAARP